MTNGNKVTELVKSKNGNEYLKVVKEEVSRKKTKRYAFKIKCKKKNNEYCLQS